MKVCILSDSHDHIPLLEAAVMDAIALGAKVVLHCGDLVAASTLNRLEKLDIPVHVIHGNNTGDLHALTRMAHKPGTKMQYHGMDAGIILDGKRIFLVHYPHYAMALAATGDWDLVCCGHSHQVSIDTVSQVGGGEALVVNPGTIGGVGKQTATWVLGDLDTMEMQVHQVSKDIEFQDQRST